VTADFRPLPIDAFAAAVVHDFGTPLCALSGEVELALRRERPPADYRAALERIAQRVADLIELTSDLALLGPAAETAPDAAPCVGLQRLLEAVALGCRGRGASIDPAPADAIVRGDGALVARALTLLVEHAIRYGGAAPRLRIEAGASSPWVDLAVEGVASGLRRQAWLHLSGEHDGRRPAAAGLLRLRAAARVIEDCGGRVEVRGDGTFASVHVRLPRADADPTW
jgi:K+-sensing histidine kinase KdpD